MGRLNVLFKVTVSLVAMAVLVSTMLIAFQKDERKLEIAWSKQLGTAVEDTPMSIALDEKGDVYIAGVTGGNLFGENKGRDDIFIVKLKSNGEMVWSKQLGTELDDCGILAVDRDGNVYVGISTEGSWFGQNVGERDIVIIKFSSDGRLLWGKHFGTRKDEVPIDITTDRQGKVYLAGITRGNLFAKNSIDDYETVIINLDPNGNMIWGKQFSGMADDMAMVGGISVNHQGNIYIGGFTEDVDTHISKLTTKGQVIWKRVEKNTEDECFLIGSMGVDEDGNVYVVGKIHVYIDENRLAGVPDGLIAKYNGANGERLWIKRFRSEEGKGEIAEEFWSGNVDGQGNVYGVGMTEGNLFGKNLGDADVIIAKLDVNGNVLWSKQLGTEKREEGRGIVVDGQGHLYIVGRTNGNMFGTNVGEWDVFIVKFSQ